VSEPKLISPLLDNFDMGDPISNHNGVRCCPAMKKNSDQKYIVKIISIPASQVQLDALLLSGAYQDAESARSYFKELSESVVDEFQILKKLSQLEGFLPYEDCQVIPMDDGTGYDVYLLSPFNRTLEQYFRRNSMTHLGALNLGLDMCAALAVCRHSGYLYVDLKPGNIFLMDHAYRIGDLGFIRLDSLKYASLPDKYRSQYTVPEVTDAFSSLNETIDIYAVGLILYQAYNDGVLPFKGDTPPTEEFPAPAYADYEMAEIILKACAPDPKDRWQDPIQMGQALVSYMQRNGANDTPITPVASVESTSDFNEAVIDDDDASAENAADFNEVLIKDDNAPTESPDDFNEVITEDDPVSDDQTSIEVREETVSEVDETPDPASCNESAEDDQPSEADIPAVSNLDTATDEDLHASGVDTVLDLDEPLYIEDDFGNLAFLADALYDETTPDNDTSEIEYHEVSDEVSEILSYADELIAHPTPDPVIPPELIDVPIPPPLPVQAEDSKSDNSHIDVASAKNNADSKPQQILDGLDDDSLAESVAATVKAAVDEQDEEYVEDVPDKPKVSVKRWILPAIILLAVLGIIFLGFYYYQNYYLQPIAITLEGNDESLFVYVTAEVDESKLSVICSDTYGNQLTSPVENGKAEFTDLAPGSGYTVKVVIDGFYRLTGNTSTAYSTPVQTNIVQFDAITGTEDGSVILSFTIDGPDSQQWTVRYFTDGEDEKATAFSGHMVTINGLTPGRDYTFTLEPENNLYITGNTQLTFTANKIIRAENLTITSCNNNALTAVWDAPQDLIVESWTVRCYNDNGYDKTITTVETSVVFDELDHTDSYTVEVIAANMSVSERAYIAKNSITVSDFQMDASDPNKLILSWTSNQSVLDNGWILLYTVDGSAVHEANCSAENTAEISPAIPGGTYDFTLLTANGDFVFDGSYTYTAAEPAAFEGYNVSSEYMEFNMCKTPDVEDWDRYDLEAEDYTTSFAVGEKASFLVRMYREYNTSNDTIVTLFLIRDAEGNIVSMDTNERTWTSMWYRNYCELDIPSIPDVVGNYSISVYFNGSLAGERNFSVVSA